MSLPSSVFQKGPLRSCFVGLAVATPVVSILQGALLLADYRANHGKAPYPETPSRGIVIVEPPKDNISSNSITSQAQGLVKAILRRQTTLLNNEPPLRILVLGDSLAAGVGMSQSSTPALPESIARGLSQAMGGRAVYWTCIGSPGSTSREVIEQILDLDDLRAPLVTKIMEWQEETRLRAENTRRAAKEWWDIHKEPVEIDESQVQNPVRRWWKRFRIGVQRDFRNLRKVVEPIQQPLDQKERSAQKLDKRVTRMLRRQSLKPSFFGQYDIAVVLCGLNDLKDSFLPFLNQKRQAPTREEVDADEGDGIQNKLIRIVHTLRTRMNISDTQGVDTITDFETSDDDNNASQMRGDAPLIVFPALPIEPTILSQIVPLSWFLVPLVHAMDRNKKHIAEMYPGLVLFVESPSPQVFSDAQSRRGLIWDELQRENILLKLSDVANTVQSRIKDLMDEHYQKLVCDQEDDLYQLDLDGFELVDDLASSNRPGAAMVATDGIHPNDLGYEVWGRFIARQIHSHLEKESRSS